MRIEEVLSTEVVVTFSEAQKVDKLMNHYMIFKDDREIVGEVISINKDKLRVRLLGEIINNAFIYGVVNKPTLQATIAIISNESSGIINSYPEGRDSLYLGHSPIFTNLKINMNLTNFFNSHFSIIGGTGAGKSFALSRIVQTLFEKPDKAPYKASIFVFDTYGEYYPSFLNLESNNPNIAFKSYTTNPKASDELLKIPPFLLGTDDLAILLNVEETQQLKVLDKALELVNIFKRNDSNIDNIKNDIIARAILDILL